MTNDTVHLQRMLWFDDWIRKNNIIIVMCLKFKSDVLMRACPKKNYLDWSSTACKLLMMCFGVSGRKSHSINAEVDFWATLETILAIWASDIQIVLVSIRFHSLNTIPPPSPTTWNVTPCPYVYVKIIFCQKESLQVLFSWKWKIHSPKRASNLRLLLARTGLTLALASGRALNFKPCFWVCVFFPSIKIIMRNIQKAEWPN